MLMRCLDVAKGGSSSPLAFPPRAGSVLNAGFRRRARLSLLASSWPSARPAICESRGCRAARTRRLARAGKTPHRRRGRRRARRRQEIRFLTHARPCRQIAAAANRTSHRMQRCCASARAIEPDQRVVIKSSSCYRCAAIPVTAPAHTRPGRLLDASLRSRDCPYSAAWRVARVAASVARWPDALRAEGLS